MDKQIVDAFTMELISPSTMRVTWEGKATAAAAKVMHPYAMACNAELGEGSVRNLLIDATSATGVHSDARKVFNRSDQAKAWKRVAFVGVRAEIKVMVELIITALKLMKMDTAEVRFVASEAEALAWFEDADP